MAQIDLSADEEALNPPDSGCLPAWGVADLPVPPRFNLRGVIRAIGPGVIILGGSIGTGEWLLGPAVTARYGGGLLWLATVAILLQLFLNWECARYALATGEPVFTAYMRCRPGPRFWGFIYLLLDVGMLWPAFAASVATLLAAAFLSVVKGQVGYMPGPQDKPVYLAFAYGMMFLCVLIVSFGGKIYNALQIAMYFMVVWILGYLIYVDVFLVKPDTWIQVITGFSAVGWLPREENLNWALIAGFAAFAGAGGLSNATVGNYLRDKGWGMGKLVGAIPSAVGSQKITLYHIGAIFRPTRENLARWQGWWKIVFVDQCVVWACGCFLGMLLPALLTVQFVPRGTDFTSQQMQVAAIQAKGIADAFPHARLAFWVLTLICGFWILFSTQLQTVDHVSRRWTDILWTGSARAHQLKGHQVKYIYYGILVLYTAWGCVTLLLQQPMTMVLIASITGGFAMSVCAVHTVYVNRRFLPRRLWAPLWREAMLVLCALFYITTTSLVAAGQLKKILAPKPPATRAAAPRRQGALRYHRTAVPDSLLRPIRLWSEPS
ncbi:MAG: Nramp family divalent metal transporter [Armatimonadetes bacterium]|nr:Nramp family divalent metal transporter [Armatimonadota bacterium]